VCEHKGRIIYSTNVWTDPTFFPFRKRGEERATSLSEGVFMSGKEQSDQEIPIPPEIEKWINTADM
jgi:hypothetical protein